MIGVGSKVSWTIDDKQAVGTVVEVFFDPVTKLIQGTEVTCLGSRDNPAYLIVTDDGAVSLHLKSEVRPETGGL